MNPKPFLIINVIHLPERVDRMTLLLNEVASQKYLTGECVNLVHGIRTKPAFVGINKSHKKVVQFAKDNDMECVCIAEDDIKFTHPHAWKYFIDQMPAEFDIYLGGIYTLDELPNVNCNHKVTSFTGMTLYVVHQKFYDTFLNLPEQEHIDQALTAKGDYIVCNPMVVLQHDTFSDNAGKVTDYSKYFTNKQLYNGSDIVSGAHLSGVSGERIR